MALLFLVVFIIFGISVTEYALKYLYPLKYTEYVNKYAEEYQLDRSLVYSMIKAESSFDSQAISPRQAKGLMQIMDSTGKWAAEKIEIKDYNPDMLLDPETNIRIGCWYLARLLKQYDQDVELALAAYNAGSGNVSKWLKNPSLSSDGDSLDIIPFEETNNYVARIEKYNKMYKKLYDELK